MCCGKGKSMTVNRASRDPMVEAMYQGGSAPSAVNGGTFFPGTNRRQYYGYLKTGDIVPVFARDIRSRPDHWVQPNGEPFKFAGGTIVLPKEAEEASSLPKLPPDKYALTDILGIGATKAAMLEDDGVLTVAQFAQMSPDHRAKYTTSLYRDRMEEWLQQNVLDQYDVT